MARRRGRRIALAILAICALPTAAAWFAYFIWQPQSRSNYGELIAPRPLSDPAMELLGGGSFRLSELRGRWVMVLIGSGRCLEPCRTRLLYMRQARLAQGSNAGRIERVWIVSDSLSPGAELRREYEGMHMVRTRQASFLAEFPAVHDPSEHIYLVDPLGNLMLRFPPDLDARRFVKDLARLLRASRIG